MAKSELYLEFKATIGKKVVTIPAVKIADGVISTSELVNNTLGNANPALGEVAFQRIIKEKHDANIMFLIQQANIRSSELKTAKEFNKEVEITPSAIFTAGIVTTFFPIVALNSRYNSDLAISGT